MRKRNIVLFSLVAIAIVAAGVYAYYAVPRPEYQPYVYGDEDRDKLERLTLLNHEEVMHSVVGHPRLPVTEIGILVYDGVSTLEAVSAMVVFSELMNVNVMYIGMEAGTVSTDLVDIVIEDTIESVDALDALLIPGGSTDAMSAAMQNEHLIHWIQQIDQNSIFTASVGYGSLFLSEAGLLEGKQIAASWPLGEDNALALGATFSPERYTQDGKYWTSVGGTAAIDMTLGMVQAIAGNKHLQGAMLDLEYDPAPPFAGGTAETTPTDVLTALQGQAHSYGELTLLDSYSASQGSGVNNGDALQVGIFVYDGFFTLDAIGPLAVLSQMENAEVRLIRYGDSEEIKTGRTRLLVPVSIDDVTELDLLLIPGGSDGTWKMVQTTEVHDWIRHIDASSRYTASVCTGSWVLGAAGLLEGRTATTNWYRAGQMMQLFGAEFVPLRYTSDGKYWTSAGVSAGIDMSYALIAELNGTPAAKAAMMRLYYAPQPPIDAGSPEKTDDLVLDMMHQMYDYQMVPMLRNYP